MSGTQLTKFSGYRVAIAIACILFMHQGSLGTIGIYMVPISEGVGKTIGEVSIMITFATATAAICGIFVAGPLLAKFGPRNLLFVSTVLLFAHYMGYSYATELWQLYMFAAVGGLAMTVGTVGTGSAIVGMWFIEGREKVNNMVMGVSLLGTAVFMSMTGYLVASFGYRASYRIEAVMVLAVGIIVNLLFVRTPQQLGQMPKGHDNNATSAANGGASAATIGTTLAETMKTPSFYIIFIGLFLLAIGGGLIMNYKSAFMTGVGLSTTLAANIFSASYVLGSIIVMGSGFLLSKIGQYAYISIIVISLVVSGLVLGYLAPEGSMVFIILGMALTSLGTPYVAVLGPNVAGMAFGNKEYGKILMYLVSANYLGSCLSPILFSTLSGSGMSIANIFTMAPYALVISLVLIILGISISPMKKLKKQQSHTA